MLKLYDYLPSQNAYKVRLLLSHLGLAYGFAHEADLPLETYPGVVNWIARVRRQPGFLATVHPYSIDPSARHELP